MLRFLSYFYSQYELDPGRKLWLGWQFVWLELDPLFYPALSKLCLDACSEIT